VFNSRPAYQIRTRRIPRDVSVVVGMARKQAVVRCTMIRINDAPRISGEVGFPYYVGNPPTEALGSGKI
jgi:hypothetical protein